MFYTLFLFTTTFLFGKNAQIKSLISLFHGGWMTGKIIYAHLFDIATYGYMMNTIANSLSYLLIDSLIYPRQRHWSIHLHHCLIITGTLYGVYIGLEQVIFYSYIGECLSFFFHLRKILKGRWKSICEGLLVLTFIPTRLAIPALWYGWLIRRGQILPIAFYTGYMALNLYWGTILLCKILYRI